MPPQQSVVYRALPDVGENAFVEAIASTYEGTRDSWINQTVDEHGAIGAARADFDDYRQMEHLPEWWELAYTADGELAGVIMAARNPTTAVIAYVGVLRTTEAAASLRSSSRGAPSSWWLAGRPRSGRLRSRQRRHGEGLSACRLRRGRAAAVVSADPLVDRMTSFARHCKT